MTIEEFLLPMSVQNVAPISVYTWDIREGEFRPIDKLDLQFWTQSGPIIKMSDIVVGSKVTGMTDQTYSFNLKLSHSVPTGGYFSFILAEQPSKGVRISSTDKVEDNCYLVT